MTNLEKEALDMLEEILKRDLLVEDEYDYTACNACYESAYGHIEHKENCLEMRIVHLLKANGRLTENEFYISTRIRRLLEKEN